MNKRKGEDGFRLGATANLLGFTIKSVLESFNTQFDLEESTEFFKDKEVSMQGVPRNLEGGAILRFMVIFRSVS